MALAGLLAVVLSACGGDDSGGSTSGGGGLGGVEVAGDVGSEPTVTFDQPLQLTASDSTVVSDGDGETVADGDQITAQYALVNATTGITTESSYATGPVPLSLAEGAIQPEPLRKALVGKKVGDRVLIGIAPADGFQSLPPQASIAPEDSILFVIDVVSIVPTQASGTEVTDVPATLPAVQTDADGAVTGIAKPAGDPPTELVVQPLIEGDGAEVTADAALTVHYWGVTWATGETFDSSWERGEPAQFGLDQVIAGWTEGLTGQKVGSRVLLVVPPDKGYGDEEKTGIPPGSTLVFVVDILAAQ